MKKAFFLWALIILGCNSGKKNSSEKEALLSPNDKTMIRSNLYAADDDYERIRSMFSENNPGYSLDFHKQVDELSSTPNQQVLFVQGGGGTAWLNDEISSKISVGDIILLDPGTSLKVDSLIDILAFTVPDAPADSIPRFIRPDWDMNITDVPGGCATATNAYRRILLTWLGHVGHYLYKSLNAHRVRITDSFTHYHPENGGFDEFYLVQMVQPGGAIITGNRHDVIEKPDLVDESMAKNLLQKTELAVGDLVYLPRGVVHRGINGVLAQVITVPGFIPGAEIGVDYHLKKINDKLGLTGNDSLPYYAAAADSILIK